MKNLLLFVLITATASWAQARGYVGGMSGVLLSFNGFLYNQTRDPDPGSSSDDNLYIYDVKLGYLDGNGLYLGGIYTSRNHNGSAISSEDGNALGASIGYVGESGFYIMGHYYLSAKLGDHKDGTGYQGDFGYMTDVSGAFYVGVELTYRNLTYKKNDADPSQNSYSAREIFPMLTAAFIF